MTDAELLRLAHEHHYSGPAAADRRIVALLRAAHAAGAAAERERLAALAESRGDGWHSLTADEIRRGAL